MKNNILSQRIIVPYHPPTTYNKTHNVYNLIESSPIDSDYIDFINKFSHQPSLGSGYILVVYYYDAHTILSILLSNRQV